MERGKDGELALFALSIFISIMTHRGLTSLRLAFFFSQNCPKCASEHHKSRRVTSLGGAGKIKRGRTVHGQSNPLRDTQKNGKNMDVEYDTPFDDLGRCHHHPRVQMATKKVRGGWKILMNACPKCIEAKYDEDCSVTSSKSGGSRSSRRSKGRDVDDGSVSSRSSKRSVTSRNSAITPGGKFDKNGCCTKHPCLQIAKKKLLGGWKEFRVCPKCLDPSYDDMSEVASVSSKRSNTSFRSTASRKSSRSVKSNSSRKGGRKTDRYGMLPFDNEGYCHAHPSVRIAKKKALGGWKVSNQRNQHICNNNFLFFKQLLKLCVFLGHS